ncbi:hypothetical protein AMTR_s00046p00226620 [Amborella trichopoda]|uniref:Uncharacterized protein n=1 Tax=Amborella trichopoda TaxID=13333 RepID=U5DCG8_AMBTC|nr:hypothetical protein AMTR_s00046p00226620 [Amborella trichopoda]
MEGLKLWAEQEIQHQGVQHLTSAMTMAELLVEYKRNDPSKQCPSKSGQAHSGGDPERTFKEGLNRPSYNRDNCPKRKALNALAAKLDEQEEEDSLETQMGSIQLLNTVKAEIKKPKQTRKGLMYMEAKINGKPTKAMSDTSATHNFASIEEAQWLGLQVTKEPCWTKTVNSNTKSIHGVTNEIDMNIGYWRGKIDLSIVPLETFRLS